MSSQLTKVLDDIGCKIAKEALDFAMHTGRKTIKAEDIEIAAKKVMERQSTPISMFRIIFKVLNMFYSDFS